MTNQTPQPRNDAGRYGETPREDPGQLVLDVGVLDLWDPADGSFEFPPYPNTAADAVRFWMRVPIGDEVLVATVAGYQARQAEEARRERDLWQENHPTPSAAKYDRWVNACMQHMEDWKMARAERMPADMPNLWTRPLVRIAKLHEVSGWLPDDEREQLRNLVVTMPGGQQLTVRHLVDLYRLVELRPQMNDFTRKTTALGTATFEARNAL